MALLKGSGWLVNFDYIKKTFGNDAVTRVLETMSPSDKDILSKPIWASAWGPDFSIFMRFIIAADKLLANGDMALLPKAAAYHFERDTKMYAVFFKVLKPDFMMKRIPLIWGQYFSNGGEAIVNVIQKNHTELILKNFDNLPEHHELYHNVYFKEILKRAHCQNINITHPKCLGRGDDHCSFVATWE